MQAKTNIFSAPGYAPPMPAGRPPLKTPTEFGQRLAAARKNAGLTQLELGVRVGQTQRVVAYWERESIGLKAEQMTALADGLGVSVDALLGRAPKQAPRGGPAGRAKRVFEQLTSLPRERQRRVLDVLETVLAGERAQRTGP
jgi:transcriptional regulator with XRE-family HTH domain